MQNTNCINCIISQYWVNISRWDMFFLYCANIDLPILPILIYLHWHNIGKSILVQNCRQHWVNIATNIGTISRWTTVFLYCANIGCRYRANNGLPLLARIYWHIIGMPILAQYRKTVVHAYIGSILLTILSQYCFQCWTNIAPMLLATREKSLGAKSVVYDATMKQIHKCGI